VIRLFLTALCALGLAFSPAATSGAIAAQSATPGCAMDGRVPAKPVDHSRMDCCTPACPVSSAAALSDGIADAAPSQPNAVLLDAAAVKELASFTARGLDPPPRTVIS
jgi:hypothetical protein